MFSRAARFRFLLSRGWHLWKRGVSEYSKSVAVTILVPPGFYKLDASKTCKTQAKLETAVSATIGAWVNTIDEFCKGLCVLWVLKN